MTQNNHNQLEKTKINSFVLVHGYPKFTHRIVIKNIHHFFFKGIFLITLIFSSPVFSLTKAELYQQCEDKANWQCSIFEAGAGSAVILGNGYLYGSCALYKTTDPTGKGGYSEPCGNPAGLVDGCPNSETFNFSTGLCGQSPKNSPGNSCSSAGKNEQTSAVGNPINLITGNKFTDETDYQSVGSSPLQFTRHYNSMTSYQTNFGVLDLSRQPLGSSWSHNYYKGLLAYIRDLY